MKPPNPYFSLREEHARAEEKEKRDPSEATSQPERPPFELQKNAAAPGLGTGTRDIPILSRSDLKNNDFMVARAQKEAVVDVQNMESRFENAQKLLVLKDAPEIAADNSLLNKFREAAKIACAHEARENAEREKHGPENNMDELEK